jgi:signal peptidase I
MDEQPNPPQPPAPAPPTTAPPAAEPVAQISTLKGIKETLESIFIAFILAFIFRAFVVEAFVIPTGSMATTLLGAHMRFTCKECGYTFDVGYQGFQHGGEEIDIPPRAGPVDTRPTVINAKGERERNPYYMSYNPASPNLADRVYAVQCPNCRHKVTKDEATNPPVRYGDRILVLKYIYIPWVSSPQRWDVVVFKNPTDYAGKPSYSQNYIKRLIGRPGEWVMILDGDIYVCNDPAYADVSEDEAGRIIPPEKWVIQTKPRYAQGALWRVIYDHDYRPLELDRDDNWKLPWVASGEWDTGDKRSHAFTFNDPAGSGTLRFDAPRGSTYFTDWLAYNAMMNQHPEFPDTYDEPHTAPATNYTVSDLKLSFVYRRQSGDGPLRATLAKQGHEFVAELTPGTVKLIHRIGDKQVSAKTASLKNAAVHVDLANVDHHVTVEIDGQVVLETTPEEYAPDVAALLARHNGRRDYLFPAPSVSIEAGKQQAELSHVSLWRDVYYTPEDSKGGGSLTWGRPGRPIKLKDDEYFVMGDNSSASYDARFWGKRVDLPGEDLSVEGGRVPGRFLLGRAFFVYWPAGYRPLPNSPALIPNFGDMRLIR